MENIINVAIIGAGLSGLSCAKYLEQNKRFKVSIYEKDSRIGGRIKSDKVDGFIFDHGFQVLLPNYPEVQMILGNKEIEVHPFPAGAKINNRYIGDPLRDIHSLIPTLSSGIGSFKDKLLILKLRLEKKAPRNKTAREFLVEYGFSDQMISQFFVPFFAGVFLNKELENSAEFFLFLFKTFAKDYATLPKNGMEDLPKAIAKQLKRTQIHLNTVTSIQDGNTLEINKERAENYDIIVNSSPDKNSNFYEVTTDYFQASKGDLTEERYSSALNLFTNIQYINHIAPVSLVNPNYAPSNKILFSVNCLKQFDIELVKKEFQSLYTQFKFEHMKRYVIKKALPKMDRKDEFALNDDVFRCGDYLESPSINGAILSGRKLAYKIISQYT